MDWTSLSQLPPDKLILGLILLTLPIIPNLWAIWHAFHRQFPSDAERLIWIGLGVFIPVAGGLAYLLIGFRRSRKFEPPSELPRQDGDGPDSTQ